MKTGILAALILLVSFTRVVHADPQDWQHSGSIYLLTTPEGANLDAAASLDEFPILVRLHKDFFNFSQAKPNGEDLRFFSDSGQPLAYQIEEWDAAKGSASIWVRVPHIQGNTRQEMKLRWGKPDAISASSGAAVFNELNGYLSVWHMSEPIKDESGTLQSKVVGTTTTPGIIGQARHFAGGEGIFCGDKITSYPSGASAHSSEAWFKASQPNVTILAWGNEVGGRGSKVRMQFRSPPHIHIDSNFSDVNGQDVLATSEWIHVAHTYERGDGKIYINGRLDASAKPILDIKNPARLWIGGWYNHYDFVGDMDEVRISKIARSADWVKLEYENQKPMNRLVGPVVQSGNVFAVTPTQVTMKEGKSAMITAQAGGAQKTYWTLNHHGSRTLLATDRFHYNFDAGRVTGDQSATLEFKAVYANEVKIQNIPIVVQESIPDPEFTLQAPATWDGRATVEVAVRVTNQAQMTAAGAGGLHDSWTATDIAVTREVVPGKLILHRAQNSGKLTVTATLDNGGKPITQSVDISVKEPVIDPWVERTPAPDEKPEENQFYARNAQNEGTLYYNGKLPEVVESVFLKVYADDKLYKQERLDLRADRSYAFNVKLKPGLIQYKVEFGSTSSGKETVRNVVNNLVCGDAYLIEGQSNAVATSWGKEEYSFTSPWIRTYGSMNGSEQGSRLKLWGNASARGKDGQLQLGYWGMELGRRLVENQKVPICIINGAVGGTRIDQHQRNVNDPVDVASIYGRLLWRVREAKLTHGIRGVLWHQGENDQGADGPTGGFGWETYRTYFLDMAAGWKQDYPNIQHYYVFQIWPKSCAMGVDGSDNRLREVQRTLPTAFSRLSVMSTLGIDPPGDCHYPPAGYAEIARLICPLVERDFYGKRFAASITPPDLIRAYYTSEKKDEIAMEFDQPVTWDNTLAGQFYLDGAPGKVESGKVVGNRVIFKLAGAFTAQKISYLDSKLWSQKTLLRGENGIAALTFYEVPILPPTASKEFR